VWPDLGEKLVNSHPYWLVLVSTHTRWPIVDWPSLVTPLPWALKKVDPRGSPSICTLYTIGHGREPRVFWGRCQGQTSGAATRRHKALILMGGWCGTVKPTPETTPRLPGRICGISPTHFWAHFHARLA